MFGVVAALTVTLAAPLSPPAKARTVSVTVPLGGAVYSPVLVMVPPAPLLLTDQVKLGCAGRATPNWSYAVALNCCEPECCTVVLAGATPIDESVALTLTATLLVAVCVPSEIVTLKLYVPALVKVAVVVLAALVALAEKLT